MQMSNMGQTRNVHDKVPADNAPEQHGSDQECKVPADKSKNVNSDNEPHNVSTNVSTNPCETTSESGSPPEATQCSSPSNCFSSSFLGHQ